ncbi:TPA: hypothetical protein ACN37B_004761, partial [Vibrio parahaemolyticus]
TGLASTVKIFGVYWFRCSVFHLYGRTFHVLSGGTRCVFFALILPFTVSNFRAISLVWFLWRRAIFGKTNVFLSLLFKFEALILC